MTAAPAGGDRPAPPAARPLVIGYGNPLRGDDGVGWYVAHALAGDPRAAEVDVVAAHQLSPEFAEDLAAASIAVLVDACVPGARRDGAWPAPGRWVVTRVSPPVPGEPAVGERTAGERAAGERAGGGRAAGGPGAWSHHHTPEALAALAREIYGVVAPVTVLGVGVLSLDTGDSLTAPVAQAVPSIVDAVLDLVGAVPAAHRGRMPADA